MKAFIAIAICFGVIVGASFISLPLAISLFVVFLAAVIFATEKNWRA